MDGIKKRSCGELSCSYLRIVLNDAGVHGRKSVEEWAL
jgi:hypothetical protein